MRVSDRSVEDNFQVSDLSNPAENGGWAGELERRRRFGWKNHSFNGVSILRGDADSIILNVREPFVLGKLRQGIYSQYKTLVEPDPQKCSRLRFG